MLNTKQLAEVERKFHTIKQCINPTPPLNLTKFTPQTQTQQISFPICNAVEEEITFLCPSPIILSESVATVSTINCCPTCNYQEHGKRKCDLVNSFVYQMKVNKKESFYSSNFIPHDSRNQKIDFPTNTNISNDNSPYSAIETFIHKTLAFNRTIKSLPILGKEERNLLQHRFLK
jgi:hypothetical protein